MKLHSLEVNNFRSIRGTIDCNLDASVILIHGPNGSGKTSLISAIELGLTGGVNSLSGFGAEYAEHLLHSGTDSGSVTLKVAADGLTSRTFELKPGASSGVPLLDPVEQDFLRERAYLAQSTMARLLETYEESDRRGESALTRFVNELLGLETLDALIAGLEPARDVRRVRKLVPEFADLEAEIEHLGKRAGEIDSELSKASSEHAQFIRQLESLESAAPPDAPSLAEVAGLQDRIRLLAAQFESVKESESTDFLEIEAQLQIVVGRIGRWLSTSLASFQALMQDVIGFTNADVELSAEPAAVSASLDIAESLVKAQLAGTVSRIAADRANRARLAPLKDQIETSQAGVAEINAEIAGTALGLEARGLIEALTALSAHVEDNVCPVCGRDFSETERGSLAEHLTKRVSELGLMTERIAKLGERRRTEETRLAVLVDEQRRVLGSLEPDSTLVALTSAATRGNDLLARLGGARNASEEVSRDVAERQKLEALLSASRAAAEQLNRLRRDLSTIGVDAGLDEVRDTSRPLSEQIEETRNQIDSLSRDSEAASRAAEHRFALTQAAESMAREIATLRGARDSTNGRLTAARSQFAAAKKRVSVAAELSKSAVDLRGRIVEQVFDSTLNGTWRDLFTRLTPEEPYIPEFVASGGTGSGVRLQAVNKRTGTAGSPGLLLSAGNLNTAALTLFLSLNATANTTVDLLLLDDPVQAMDDVHVAQFSALLRSFARDLGRQVVIAVHERPLFEYLSLELAPANEGEALVAIELSRSSNQDTQSVVRRYEYSPDPIEAGLTAA